MKQISAVEFLTKKLEQGNLYPKSNWEKFIKEAKEMEREQICDAWYNSLTKGEFNSAQEYYNATFKSE